MERLAELSRPLFGQGWRAEDDHAAYLGAFDLFSVACTGAEAELERLVGAVFVLLLEFLEGMKL